jgi:hypothetical protein
LSENKEAAHNALRIMARERTRTQDVENYVKELEALALTKIEEAMFWANAGIAREKA